MLQLDHKNILYFPICAIAVEFAKFSGYVGRSIASF